MKKKSLLQLLLNYCQACRFVSFDPFVLQRFHLVEAHLSSRNMTGLVFPNLLAHILQKLTAKGYNYPTNQKRGSSLHFLGAISAKNHGQTISKME